MSKIYSLAIGKSKLEELRRNKGGIITHRTSPRWENFYKKHNNEVRFFDTVFYETCVCSVVSIKKIYWLRECIIRIEVKL